MGSLGSDIPDIEKNLSRKLSLDREVPALNIRRAPSPERSGQTLPDAEGWADEGRSIETLSGPAVLEDKVKAGTRRDNGGQQSVISCASDLSNWLRGIKTFYVL